MHPKSSFGEGGKVGSTFQGGCIEKESTVMQLYLSFFIPFARGACRKVPLPNEDLGRRNKR